MIPHDFFGWFFFLKLFPSLILAGILFLWHRPKRKYFCLRFFLPALAMTALSAWLWAMFRNSWFPVFDKWGFVLCSAFYVSELFVLFYFSFRCEPMEVFLYVIAAWAVEHLSHMVTMILVTVFGVTVDYTHYTWQYFTVTMAAYCFVYALVFFLFFRLRNKNLSVRNKRILFPATILFAVIFVLKTLIPNDLSDTVKYIVYAYAISCCAIMLFLVWSAFEEGRLTQELTLISQLDRKRAEQYEMSRESIEVVNTRCHDLKKLVGQIIANRSTVDMEEVKQELETYDAIVKTDNPAFDTILTEKSLFCEKHGIRLTVIADTKRLGFLSDIDIYSIFGNILDNAIEASLKMAEDRRAIGLTVRSIGDLCSIHSDNLFDGTLKFSGKKIATSKQNASEHGFGLTSIRRITEKYGGEMKITAEEGVFNLDIVIPIPHK